MCPSDPYSHVGWCQVHLVGSPVPNRSKGRGLLLRVIPWSCRLGGLDTGLTTLFWKNMLQKQGPLHAEKKIIVKIANRNCSKQISSIFTSATMWSVVQSGHNAQNIHVFAKAQPQKKIQKNILKKIWS